MLRLCAIAFALLFLVTHTASAHTRSQSFSTWTIHENTLEGVFQVDAYRATQLSEVPQDLLPLLTSHLIATLTLEQGGTRCVLAPPGANNAPRGDLRVSLRFDCPKPITGSQAKLKINAFFDVSISHVHYIRISGANGAIVETILSQGNNSVIVGQTVSEAQNIFLSFLTLGFEHVLSGVDHIAFLLALAMLAGGPWRTLLAVTGFTLGHTLTLALVVLGILKPDTPTVEALIGFTVAWAAGDALARARNVPQWYGLAGSLGILTLPVLAWSLGLPVTSWLVLVGLALFAGTMSYARTIDAARIAPVIATVFGLAHGAGFAGPLLALKILPNDLAWTLLAFNLGVECGQLAVLGGLGAAYWLMQKYAIRVPSLSYDIAAALLFALGTFWFVSRTLT